MPRKDPEARKAYQKEYAMRKKEEAYARVKEWRAANPAAWREQRQRYAKKHPDIIAAKSKRFRDKNIEDVRAKDRLSTKAYRANNKVKVSQSKLAYARRNKHIVNALWAKRKSNKLLRTPQWIGSEELWLIKEVYALSALRTEIHGFSWHVDHIIPLQGELVSGLHVPENLQVIPAVENIRKSNNFEVA